MKALALILMTLAITSGVAGQWCAMAALAWSAIQAWPEREAIPFAQLEDEQ